MTASSGSDQCGNSKLRNFSVLSKNPKSKILLAKHLDWPVLPKFFDATLGTAT